MLLVFELVGPSYRASISIASETGWCISNLLLPICQYFIPHFRYMQLCVFGYELIFLIFLWQLPESPRWLITHDRFDEAAELITKTAKSSKQMSDADIDRKMMKFRNYLENEEKRLKLEAKMSIVDLWRQPTLLRYCIFLYMISICLTFIGYGISYNAASFGESLYVTMFVQGLSDTFVFSALYFCIDRFARKSLTLFIAICSAGSICAMLACAFDSNVKN